MSGHERPGFEPGKNCPLRRKHDDFVESQAARLHVEPADILAAVRDFGLTASDIAAADDASALTRYPGRNGFPSFKVLGFVPVKKVDSQSARHEFTVRKANNPKAKKMKRGHPARQTVRQSSAWPGDRGATSMADAIRKVGLRK